MPSIHEWSGIYKVIANSVSLVDRTEKIQIPFNVKLYNKYKMPTDLSDDTTTYEECCARRANELYELSKELNTPLLICYSGGIDSTLMLINFLKTIPENDKDRIHLLMDFDSIKEYPEFYKKYILPSNMKIIPSHSFDRFFDKSHIIVGGEHNDQLFGSDIVIKFSNIFGFDQVIERYTRNNITEFFIAFGMNQEQANIWFDVIDESCKTSPLPLYTVFDFLWWLNFNFKWQSVFFRMLLRCRSDMQVNINQNFIDNYYHHFYSEDYFQIWSMNNHDKKIKDEWKTYKYHAKELIYEFTKDDDYRDNKLKQPSLYKLFTLRRTPKALTTDYKFLYELEPEKLYVPDNSFVPLPLNKR
jgi:hypothetical protein